MSKQNTKLSGYNPNRQLASIPSYLGLPRISSWKKFANLLGLDTPNKLKCDCFCTGRSMVEMLGVLAIIGVLSVGAIAGYSKAMIKYRLNKQSEQLSQILFSMENLREMLGRDRNNIAVNSRIAPLLIKLNAIPVEMIKQDTAWSGDIYDVFDNRISLSYYSDVRTTYTIAIYYRADQLDVWNNIFELFKANGEKINTIGIKATCSANFTSPELRQNDLKNITKSDIYDYCALCTRTNCCRVSAQFLFK